MMPFIQHSSKDKIILLEQVAASGQGQAEDMTTNREYEGVLGDEGIVLYSDGSDGDINLSMCKNSQNCTQNRKRDFVVC